MRYEKHLSACHLSGEALGLASLETRFDRRQAQTVKMFQDFSNNPDHKLYRFLPEPNKCIFNLGNSRR